MTIRIQNLVPVPLRDKITARPSDIWNREQVFNTGEWTKIKAPSGTGKTTLIHLLYRLRTDYTGQVQYNDRNIQSVSAEELAAFRQTKISIIFQDLRLFPHLTAFENIELKRVLQTPYCTEERVREMAGALGIKHILHQKAAICSYGEQQRIAIVRALVQPFELLLMDEPFSHLDTDNTARAAALIAEECKKRNAGFVLTDLDDDRHFEYNRLLNL
jgi:ABC-type lipoprotein export system ATPase subunit